jgi:hypothetical protein
VCVCVCHLCLRLGVCANKKCVIDAYTHTNIHTYAHTHIRTHTHTLGARENRAQDEAVEVDAGQEEEPGEGAGRRAKPPAEEDLPVHRDNLKLVDEGLESAKWWGCVFVFYSVNVGIDRFTGWLEGCPCHPDFFEESTRWKRQKKWMRSSNISGKQIDACAAKGCWAPNCAAGEHTERLGVNPE